jgi:hypothetical protein
VAGTPSARPIRGAAVITIVPSRFSMKKHAATSSAVLRSRRSIVAEVLTGSKLLVAASAAYD